MKNAIIILATLLLVGTVGYTFIDKPEPNIDFGWTTDLYTASTTVYTTTAGEATIILAKNTSRAGAYIWNSTATAAYLSYHATTSPNTAPILADKEFVIPLAASTGTYVINEDNPWSGQVIASSSAAVTLYVMEIY